MGKYPKVPCEECKGTGQLVHPYYHTTSSCWRCNGTREHENPREAQEALVEQLNRIEAKLGGDSTQFRNTVSSVANTIQKLLEQNPPEDGSLRAEISVWRDLLFEALSSSNSSNA